MVWIAIILFLIAIFVDRKRALEWNMAANWALVIVPMLAVLSFFLMVIFSISLVSVIPIYLSILLLFVSGVLLYRKWNLDRVRFTNRQAGYFLIGLLCFVVLLITLFGKY